MILVWSPWFPCVVFEVVEMGHIAGWVPVGVLVLGQQFQET